MVRVADLVGVSDSIRVLVSDTELGTLLERVPRE